MIKAFLAAIIGAVIAFGWSSFSWMVLPFHQESMNHFADDAAVAEVLKSNAPEAGIYVIPFCDESVEPEARMEAMKNGPFVFASIRPGADEDLSMGTMMMRGFTSTLVAAILLAILLAAAAPRLNYIGRVFYVVLIALFVAIVGVYPNQIWFEFSSGFILTGMLDIIIGWGLAGLIMAGMITGRSAKKDA